MKKISKIELTNLVENQVNEGFWDSIFGSDDNYVSLSKDLETIMTTMVNKIYYDKDSINKIKVLYDRVKSAQIDRRDKQELMNLMLSMYHTMEFSRQKLESLTEKNEKTQNVIYEIISKIFR